MTQDPRWPAPFPMEGLIKLLRRLSGLQVVLLHKPSPVLGLRGGEQAWIKVVTASSREVGVDEQRTQADPNDPTGNALQFNLCGQRAYVVTMRAESLDAVASPVSILERIRWGLRTTAAEAELEKLGIALSDFASILHLGQMESDDRELIVATLDVTFNWAVNFTPTEDDGTSIGLVNGDPQIPGTPPTIGGTVTPDAPPPAPVFDSSLGNGAPLGNGQTVG